MGSESQPPIAASGMDPSSAARPMSAQIRTGRRRSRSTQAPATNPTSSAATRSSERRTAISIGPARSVSIATNGSAIRVTNDPKTETVAADHTRTNARLRRRPADGMRVVRGRRRVEQGVGGHRAEGTCRTIVGRGRDRRVVAYTPHASVSPEPAHHPPGACRAA